jgi:hypothetical protein
MASRVCWFHPAISMGRRARSRKLAADAALRAQLGAAANRRFLERLTEDGVQQAIGDLYRRALPPLAGKQSAGR